MDNQTLINQHKAEKENSRQFKERRFNQVNENYYLYRDKILLNRLTQRQSVNVPIMRETIQTWISKIDEAPMLEFEARGRTGQDRNGEIVLNELWSYYYDLLKLDILDNADKKGVGLAGRSFKKWGWAKNQIFCDLVDWYDIDIDPKVNPIDIDSANWVTHKNIFRPLRQLLANPKFSDEAKMQLKAFLDTKEGLLRMKDTQDALREKMERLSTLGVHNYDEFQASDVIVEVNESYKFIWSEKEQKFVRHFILFGADNTVLYNKPMKEAIGINRLPIVSWASDPDMNDVWSDGVGDSVRTFNKIANMYISQDLENRAYRNFGMYFFNTLNGTFQPRAFEARPFGMYGVPGNPDDIIKQMKIEPLLDTADQIDWLKNLVQSSVAQTATERGEQERQQTTLGEVQLNLQQSQSRNSVVSKNYRRAWKESGLIFYELLNANATGSLRLYKKGNNGEYFPKDVMPTDWQNPEGYECKVVLKAEKEATDHFDLKKLQYVKQSFQDNPVALQIAKRKELELLDWTPEEIEQVEAYQPQQPLMPQEGMVDPNAQEGAVVSPIQDPSQALV